MSHEHEHRHNHAHLHTANKRVLRTSLMVIGIFMLIEIVGGILTNSLALLSDAGHMFSDAFALGLSLWAMSLGERPADLRNTFGYRRFEVLAAAFNGITLLVIAALIAYEAAGRFVSPPPIATSGMLAVSLAGLCVNIWVAWYMLKNSDTEENLNMNSAYLHVIGDLLGSLGAVAAAVLMMGFGWLWADPLASVLVAALIARSGWGVLKSALHILMEGSPPDMDLDEIARLVRETEGVEAVHDLHVWTISSGLHVLSCRILVDGNMPVLEADRVAAGVEHALGHLNISHLTIQAVGRQGGPLLCGMPEQMPKPLHEHPHNH